MFKSLEKSLPVALTGMATLPTLVSVATGLNGAMWYWIVQKHHFEHSTKDALSEAAITTAVGGGILSAGTLGLMLLSFICHGGCGALLRKAVRPHVENDPLLDQNQNQQRSKGIDADFVHIFTSWTSVLACIFSGAIGSSIWQPEQRSFSALTYGKMQVLGVVGTAACLAVVGSVLVLVGSCAVLLKNAITGCVRANRQQFNLGQSS